MPLRRRRTDGFEQVRAAGEAGAVDVETLGACRRVRSGVGDGWACRTHGRPWPCQLADQAWEQMTLLRQADGGLLPAIVLEVVEELLHQVDVIPPGADERKQAPDWVALVVEYLNRANVEGQLLAARGAEGAPTDPREWRRRLIQVAAIAVAGVAWCDRAAGVVRDV